MLNEQVDRLKHASLFSFIDQFLFVCGLFSGYPVQAHAYNLRLGQLIRTEYNTKLYNVNTIREKNNR